MNRPVADAVIPTCLRIQDILSNSRHTLLLSHVSPDGDAIGTLLACGAYLHDLGIKTTMLRDDVIPEKYKFLTGVDDIIHFDDYKHISSFDAILVLECPSTGRMGRITKFVSDDARIINIDHHRDNDKYGLINWVDISKSSVGEMIFEYFLAVNYKIGSATAENLYTAILTDTGRFRYPSTSARTMQIAGMLIEYGADPQKICDKVYYDLSLPQMVLTGLVLSEIELMRNGKFCLLKLTREMLEKSKAELADTEGLVDNALFCKGVLAGALMTELDSGQVKVSFRSRDKLNVSEIAARFDGGGHYNAAGCTIDGSFDDVYRIMLDLIEEVEL